MPAIPFNRLRAFKARAKRTGVPTVAGFQCRVLLDKDWVFAEEAWIENGETEIKWVWRYLLQ